MSRRYDLRIEHRATDTELMHLRVILAILVGLTLSACAARSGDPVPASFPRPSKPKPAGEPEARIPPPDGYTISETALLFRGVPYRDGGDTPAGFDCSGLVRYVFTQHGIDLPRQMADQSHTGVPVDRDQIQPGDLLFFSTVAPGASHVGVSIGGDEFVHAPSSRGHVRVERVSSGYWAPQFVGARRLIKSSGQ